MRSTVQVPTVQNEYTRTCTPQRVRLSARIYACVATLS